MHPSDSIGLNDSQYFYAALYWTAALPGGLAFLDDVCKAYQKPYLPLAACQRGEDDHAGELAFLPERASILQKIEGGVTGAQARLFFDTLYQGLCTGRADKSTTWNTPAYRYIELGKEVKAHTIEDEYSDVIEDALATAGLHRTLLPMHARCYLHETGQLFVYDAHEKFSEVSYPGQPQCDFERRRFTDADFVALPELRMEILHRVVPVRQGQACVLRYDCVDGSIATHRAHSRSEDGVVIVAQGDADDIAGLTDDEILSGADKVRACTPIDKASFTPGYQGQDGAYVIATDDPRIVCWRSGVVKCLQLTCRTQVFYGSRFAIAEAGDLIERDAGGRLCLLRAADYTGGRYQMVPADGGPAPALRKGKPKPPTLS